MGRKLLVIDQNLAVQRLLEFTLSKEGFDITAVEDALAGLDNAFQTIPDLIMVDAQLEGLPLNIFMQKIRARDQLKTTPVLLMAQSGNAMNMEQLRSAGITDLLKKPLDAVEIRMVVSRCFATEAPAVAKTEPAPPQPETAPEASSNNKNENDQDMMQIEQLLGWVPKEGGSSAADAPPPPPPPAPTVSEPIRAASESAPPPPSGEEELPTGQEADPAAEQSERSQEPIELAGSAETSSLEEMLITGAEAIHYQPPPHAAPPPPPPPPPEPEPPAEPQEPSELDELLTAKEPIRVKGPGQPPPKAPSAAVDPFPAPAEPPVPTVTPMSPISIPIDQAETMIRTMVEELTRRLARETIERVAKEIVPELAEREVRAEIDRLKQEL